MFTMPRVKKIKSLKRSADTSASKVSKAPKREPMTILRFIMAVLWGTVGALTFTLIFTVYATVLFFGSLQRVDISEAFYQTNMVYEKVIYRNDKISYWPDEVIALDIVNNTDESIYLAPCQYFNRFEKKTLDGWQAVTLESCNEIDAADDASSIEKINKKVEGAFEAKKLGEGTWRGVSNIYFGCQKAEAAACSGKEIVYTNEFIIGTSNSGSEPTDLSNPQF
jgi:hypothetical protein